MSKYKCKTCQDKGWYTVKLQYATSNEPCEDCNIHEKRRKKTKKPKGQTEGYFKVIEEMGREMREKKANERQAEKENRQASQGKD